MDSKTIRKIPNILTVIRAVLVPVFMVLLMFNSQTFGAFRIFSHDRTACIVSAVIFLLISLTDMLDGKIARKYNAVSDFGKFLDPIADKLLVMGGMLALIFYYSQRTSPLTAYDPLVLLMIFSLFIVIARELAVTSLRLICKDSGGPVIAANMAGKIKTVSQIVFIIAALIEPWLFEFALGLFDITTKAPVQYITYASLIVMTVMTVYSGINYFLIYLPYLKGKKKEDQ